MQLKNMRWLAIVSLLLASSGSQSLLLELHCGRLDLQSHHSVGGRGDMGKSLGGAMHFFGGVPPLDVVSPKLNVKIIPQIFIIITLVSATIPIVRRCPMLLLSK